MNRPLLTPVLRRFARRQQGSVILETAIMLTILLTFAFGIIDFGRLMYVANALTNATRDAARWAAVQQTIQSADTISGRVVTSFNAYRFGGSAITKSLITVTGPFSPGTVTVLSKYPYTWLTPINRLVRMPSPDTIRAQSIFKYEW